LIVREVSHLDFAIFDKDKVLYCLIEYDGEQHYRPVNFGGMSDEKALNNLEKTKKHDQIKNNYCKKNNIKLIRIPYWESNNYKNILNDELKEII